MAHSWRETAAKFDRSLLYGWNSWEEGAIPLWPPLPSGMKASKTNYWLWNRECPPDTLGIEARKWEPNATAYQIDPDIGGGHISKLAGEVTSTAGKPVLLGRVKLIPMRNCGWW